MCTAALVHSTDTSHKGLAAPVFSVGLMEKCHNGILTTDIHYEAKLEHELTGSM